MTHTYESMTLKPEHYDALATKFPTEYAPRVTPSTPRLMWEGIKDSDGDKLWILPAPVLPAPVSGYVYIGASSRCLTQIYVRASAAQLWELAKAATSAAMALEGMDEPEEPVEKLPGVGPLEHYRTWAWLNLEAICRKQEGGE